VNYVSTPFAKDVRESVNYVNNFNPRPTNDPFSNWFEESP